MINPWIILGIFVAWIASLGAVGYWQHEAGVTSERSTWQARENKELKDANAMVLKLEEEARTAEAVHGEEQAEISGKLQGAKDDARNKTKLLDAALARGAVVLRDPGAGESTCPSAPGKTAAGASGRDGEAASGLPEPAHGILSEQAARFLIELAGQADEVTLQLQACQAVVVSDRK